MSKINDPTDDKMYQGLTLTDFLKSFSPQEASLQKEIEKINEKGKNPYLDPDFPEIVKPTTRAAQRQQMLAQRKADKKAKKLNEKILNLLSNPIAFKRAIATDPNIKKEAERVLKIKF